MGRVHGPIPVLALDHYFCHGFVPVLDRQLQDIPAVNVLQRDIGPVLKQQGGDSGVPILGSQVERGRLLHVHRVDGAVVLEQQVRALVGSGSSSAVKSRPAEVVPLLHGGALPQKQLHHCAPLLVGGEVQGRVVVFVLVKDGVLISFKKELDNVDVSGLGSQVERGLLVLVLVVDVRTIVKKDPYRFKMTLSARFMKRSTVILKYMMVNKTWLVAVEALTFQLKLTWLST